jgi:putative DNA primase/helicase
LAKELERRDDYVHAVDRDEGSGRLYVYCGGVYRPAGFVSNLAQELLGEETRSHRIDEAVAALKRDVAVTNDQLNHEKGLINVLNGMLDPFSGKLDPHDPSYLSTVQHAVAWNPNAASALLDEFLKVTCGDYADLICELAGYLLLPINTLKKLFVWHGDTDTGKTTMLNLFCTLIGKEHYASVSPLSVGDRFMGAQLENKLVNFFDDLPPGRIGDPALLKILTGGAELITVEPKHVNAYKVRNFCRMVFAANELPSCADKSDAWYERLCIIPFRHQVPDADKDPGLRERFARDTGIREAMLVKAVAGLRRLKERGWRLEGSEEELGAYRERNDPVMAFIAESCTVGSTECVKRTDLRDAYELYCKAHELFMFSSARKFYERVRGDRRFGEKKVNGELYFTGLSLSEGGR